MQEFFQQLTPRWFQRTHVYVGSIGPCFHDFRFRIVFVIGRVILYSLGNFRGRNCAFTVNCVISVIFGIERLFSGVFVG